jgi:plastocyanin
MLIPVGFNVKKGTTVHWRVQECSCSNAGNSNSSGKVTLHEDEALSVRFDSPGTYHFTCSICPNMLLTIVVE